MARGGIVYAQPFASGPPGYNGYFRRHCEAHRAEATQGNSNSGSDQPPGWLAWLSMTRDFSVAYRSHQSTTQPQNTNRHKVVKPLSRFELAFAMEVGRVGAADLRRDHVRP